MVSINKWQLIGWPKLVMVACIQMENHKLKYYDIILDTHPVDKETYFFIH